MNVIYPRQLMFMDADMTTNDLLPFHMLQFMQAATSYYVPTYVPTNLPTYLVDSNYVLSLILANQ